MHTRPIRRLGSAITATLLLATALAACGDSESSSGSGSGSDRDETASYFSPPEDLPVSEPVSEMPTDLDVIFVNAGVDVATKILAGLESAADELDWTVQDMKFDATNPATVASTIESAIAAKPDAIVLNGLLLPQFEAQIPAAVEAGIPLIPAATPVEAQEGVYPVLKTDVELTYASQILADTIVADAESDGTDANVVQLTVSAFAAILDYEDNGVKNRLAEKCPDCTHDLIDVPLPDVFSGKYTQQVVSYLQSHPDVKVVVSDSGDLGNGLTAALQQAGLSDVKIYGFSPQETQISELQGGRPGAWTGQPDGVRGWIVADQVARVVAGDATDLWDDEKLVYVLTQSNTADVDSRNVEFPADYQDEFKAMWGK